MAAWREQVGGPASFRGAQFRVDKSGLAGGRKTVAHEYPGKDIGFVEDLGRRQRRFSLSGYVVGDDYLQRRDDIVTALEADGPGLLVHPYHGNRLAAVLSFTIDESVGEGGIARITVEFAETEQTQFSPTSVNAPTAKVEIASDHCLATCQNRLLSQYKLTIPGGKTAPAFTFDSISTLVTDYSNTLRNSLSPVVKGTQDLASLKQKIDGIVNGVSTLVRTPASLAAKFGDVLTSFRQMPTTPRLGLKALLEAYRFTTTAPRPAGAPWVGGSIGTLTPSRTVEQTNYDAVVSYVKPVTIIEATRHAVDAANASGRSLTATTTQGTSDLVDLGGFDSYEEAIAARDTLFVAIDAEAVAANDDEVYVALLQLRAELALAVPGEQNHLPRLITYTPPVTSPSLVLAHRLYGELALTDDLVRRNRVRHPGFVVGGRALQVLAHA